MEIAEGVQYREKLQVRGVSVEVGYKFDRLAESQPKEEPREGGSHAWEE